MLKNSPRLKLAVQGISTVHSTRQPANLKQILTTSKFADKVEGIKSMYGGTKLRLRERMMLHRQQIRESGYQILPVSAHTARCAKGKEMKFTVFPFYKMSVEDDYDRRAKEQYFIEKFKPTLNAN